MIQYESLNSQFCTDIKESYNVKSIVEERNTNIHTPSNLSRSVCNEQAMMCLTALLNRMETRAQLMLLLRYYSHLQLSNHTFYLSKHPPFTGSHKFTPVQEALLHSRLGNVGHHYLSRPGSEWIHQKR